MNPLGLVEGVDLAVVVFFGAQRRAVSQHHRQFLGPRQVLETPEPEVLEEPRSGPVENGPAQPLPASHRLDEPAVQQGADDAG